MARLELFIKTVAKNKIAYGISDEEGWALLGDDEDDTDILPLFQDAALAEAFKNATGFEDAQVEAVDWTELMSWLDELEEDGLMVAVCPNTEFEGPIEEPQHLKKALLKA
ncbi:MAG: DUF2750 domain-containing protein [Saprospiraceae bacterium]|nr:DUF2750 domain-containing protein [Saprospiraceae bacterium]